MAKKGTPGAPGNPIDILRPEMIVGIFYLTHMSVFSKKNRKVYESLDAVVKDFVKRRIGINSAVRVTFSQVVKNLDIFIDDPQDIAGCPPIEWAKFPAGLKTTPGRILFNRCLPNQLPFLNGCLNRRGICNLLAYLGSCAGSGLRSIDLSKLSQLITEHAPPRQFKFSLPKTIDKRSWHQFAGQWRRQVELAQKAFWKGMLTSGEKRNRIWDADDRLKKSVVEFILKRLQGEEGHDPAIHPLCAMAASGVATLKELATAVGLRCTRRGPSRSASVTIGLDGRLASMTTSGGKIKKTYLRGMACPRDEMGKIERRLGDLLGQAALVEDDCGTTRGIHVTGIRLRWGGSELVPLAARISGRCAAEDIFLPGQAEQCIVRAGELIDQEKAELISRAGIVCARIRSPLTCESFPGICKKCFGLDPLTGSLPEEDAWRRSILHAVTSQAGLFTFTKECVPLGVGDMVQLDENIHSRHGGTVSLHGISSIRRSNYETVVTNGEGQLWILAPEGYPLSVHRVPLGSTLFLHDGDQVKNGQSLFWAGMRGTGPILAWESGVLEYPERLDIKEIRDEETGETNFVLEKRASTAMPARAAFLIVDPSTNRILQRLELQPGTVLKVPDRSRVAAGDLIGHVPPQFVLDNDACNNCGCLLTLLGAHGSSRKGVVSPADGIMKIIDRKSMGKELIIESAHHEKLFSLQVPRGCCIPFDDGEQIKRGDQLIPGIADLRQLAALDSVEVLAHQGTKDFYEIFFGYPLFSQHVETILRGLQREGAGALGNSGCPDAQG